MNYVGIDPGKDGGFAALSEEGNLIEAVKMPATPATILAWLRRYRGQRALLEFVRSSPQMGVVSVFTFGRGLGALEMALTAAGVPYHTVLPRVWQDRLECRSGGDKNITKARAIALYGSPDFKITHATADAILIAHYCRLTEQRYARARRVFSSTRNQKRSQ
jgi:hypothetical protein